MASHTKVAAGNIAPSRFLILTTTADGKVSQSGAGGRIYGISGNWTRNAPYTGLEDGYHAIAGENCLVHGVGDKCLLELGGTVTVGDRLKADADGKGVTASTDQNEYGAIAMASGTSGKLIEVQVQLGQFSG